MHARVVGHRPDPVLITDAVDTPQQEFDRRRRKYSLMMACRALCVIAAALTYHVSIWLAIGFIVGGAVLPWCAVLIANDRPAKRTRSPMQRFVAPPTDHALEAGTTVPATDRLVIEG